MRKLVKSPYALPASNIKILHSEAVYGEEFSAVWPYQGVFCGGKINNSANLPTFSHSNCRRSEAGMMHVVKNGNHTWCRAYAGGTGQWTAYDCGSDNNDQFVWFQIRTTTDGLHYHIEDCGTSGGYGSCTLDFGADSPYPDPEGGTFIETYFGCEISITGSQADQQNVGNSTYHLQGEANNGTGGTEWAARNWGNQGVYWYGIDGTKHTSTCGTTDYQMTEVNMGEQLKFYDARNNT